MITEPALELLKVNDLQVDGYAQRTYNEPHAENLAKTWDPEKVGIFKVSRRKGGGLYVMDGQHRRSAMLKQGMDTEQVFALVYEGLTLPDEARIFLRDNVSNRKPNGVDIFRLSVAAEEPDAVAINEVLRAAGLHVSMSGDSRSVSAVGALRWLYEQGGAALLARTLALTETAWPSDRSGRDGSLLKGVGYVLLNATGAKLDVTVLAQKLGANSKPNLLLGTARTYKYATGTVLWREVANVIVSIHNKGKTTQRISI